MVRSPFQGVFLGFFYKEGATLKNTDMYKNNINGTHHGTDNAKIYLYVPY